MATSKFRLLPYRDTAGRTSVQLESEALVEREFVDKKLGTPRIRAGYWYDLQLAGAPYDNSNELTFATGSNKYKFPYLVNIPLTIPTGVVYSFYGITDYSPNPSLQAMQITQSDVAFPLIYLSPEIYVSEDKKAILNGAMPAVSQTSLTITLFGTADTTDNIDLLFSVAEKAAQA
jgi:hypothetical protein